MRFFKILGLCLLSFGVIFTLLLSTTTPCFSGGYNYTYYTGKGSMNCKVVECSTPFSRLKLADVCGESCEYDNSSVEDILRKYVGEVVFTETLSDSVNYYCKADLPYSIKLYGEEINLHISVKGEKIKVASPIIFGGY
jgi:hypothetical protein